MAGDGANVVSEGSEFCVLAEAVRAKALHYFVSGVLGPKAVACD